MERSATVKPRSNFRRFFLRGLAIVLPTVLTIWILIAAYGFLQQRIAEPINAGVRELIVRFTAYPAVVEQDIQDRETELKSENPALLTVWRKADRYREMLILDARRDTLKSRWSTYAFPLDLIGLVLAIMLIYVVGGLVGSFIGHRLYARGEEMLSRLPLIRNVYPSVKQVTDFLVGSDTEAKARFNKVVAVQYPRKGVWSLGLVTGETMRDIQNQTSQRCLTVFVPSSPTPFTGYVITVPVDDTIELAVSIEEALRFIVSGGVLIPRSQQIATHNAQPRDAVSSNPPAPTADVDAES